MYTSKLKIKTSSVNAWRSLRWWPDLSDCQITSFISQGRPQKKPADHNCWDDGEARREDLGWHSEDVWRRHWRQTGRGRRGTGVLGCADSWNTMRPSLNATRSATLKRQHIEHNIKYKCEQKIHTKNKTYIHILSGLHSYKKTQITSNRCMAHRILNPIVTLKHGSAGTLLLKNVS